MYRDSIDAMADAVQRNAKRTEAKAEAEQKREELRQKKWGRDCFNKMLRATKRREIEILNRYAHRNGKIRCSNIGRSGTHLL
jgi:hypothetical protein